MTNADFNQYMQQCDGISSLDYFAAKALFSHARSLSSDSLYERCFTYVMALVWAQRNGHGCVPLNEMAEHTWWQNREAGKGGVTFPSLLTVEQDLEELLSVLPAPTPIVLYQNRLYSSRFFYFEQEIQHQLKKFNQHSSTDDGALQRVSAVWPSLFPKDNRDDAMDWQQAAVALAVQQQLLLLSGGPGTGKTYTVARLLVAMQIAHEKPLRIGLAAPTGKAAQRLSESLISNYETLSSSPELAKTVVGMPTKAVTLHRLLGLREAQVSTKFNKENRLPLDVLVVDESSMLDIALFARVLRALEDSCKLIFVGDSHQLPAVESGNVLPMIMPHSSNSLDEQQWQWVTQLIGGNVPAEVAEIPAYAISLTQTHRFGGALAELAQDTLKAKGDQQSALHVWQKLSVYSGDDDIPVDLTHNSELEQRLDDWISEYYLAVSHETTDPVKALESAMRFRVLCCLRRGTDGVEHINEWIEHRLKRKLGLSLEQRFFHGQIVMVTQNMPGLDLFNGDTGIVWQGDGGQLKIVFQQQDKQRVRSVDLQRITAIESVFAMTVHKSQGSEFNHVALVLPLAGGDQLLSNQLIYTAITRSKQRLSIVSSQDRFVATIARGESRWSGLAPLH
ncbi:exodeoxyribonuclease V subunit alpha [Alteromonas facilis]|uniref:exodeoxyribonuclease V subunit alpha n=1 Tax=Alteromonas facilis TaxID=2048004 RepID=UPI000C28148B|nr:exodeoxyribonuclease V subunit alpha [Alteromonas facilis]